MVEICWALSLAGRKISAVKLTAKRKKSFMDFND